MLLKSMLEQSTGPDSVCKGRLPEFLEQSFLLVELPAGKTGIRQKGYVKAQCPFA
jgi:hypothetical protein